MNDQRPATNVLESERPVQTVLNNLPPSANPVVVSEPSAIKTRWADWRISLAVIIAVAAGAGLLSAWVTPRGPITTAEALVSMVLALGVGVLAGAALGNRWSALVTPVVFIAVFELARIGVSGPTVDGIHLGSLVGALTFVVGRGVQGLLVLAPMMLGSVFGVELAARLGRPTTATLGVLGWATAGLLTVGLVLLGVLIARPATTAPILGPDGQPLSGSIAELTTARIGGHDQALMIRGVSTDNPVLLHLAGGPGGTDIGAMRLDTSLEPHFVVATWDQRGAGKSYAALDPTETLTLDRAVADTLEVTDYLRERFGQEKIYVAGQSWGTIPAVLAVQRHPERYHALVGTGLMVNVLETDRIFYADTLAWAEQTGNARLVAELQEAGPPPYDDVMDYLTVVGYERDLNPYPEFDGHTEQTTTIFVPENSFMDKINAARGLGDTYATLYPQLQDLDFRRDVPTLDVPVYVVMGAHEAPGRVVPAQTWFDELKAPSKEWVVFEGSSHRANFERPADYTQLLTRVLADTAPQVTGEPFGFITGVEEDPPAILLDQAEWFMGEEANSAASEDGVLAGGEELPNPFYIRNLDPIRDRWQVAPDAQVVITFLPGEVEPGAELVTDLAGLAERFRPEAPSEADAVTQGPFRITVDQGIVTRIQQQYVP